MLKNISFMSGIQRSGSTLLTKVLSQHPQLFASSTSPLFDMTLKLVETLSLIQQQSSTPHYINRQRILYGAASSFYGFTEKPNVIDKNRGWASNYMNIHNELCPNPKVIMTMRPVEEVVTSFYHILQKSERPHTIEQVWVGFMKELMDIMLNQSSLYADKFFIVTYDEITKDTENTLKKVEEYLGLDHFKYDLNNIIDNDPEDDTVWEIKDLHKIRPTISLNGYKPEDVMSGRELAFCKKQTQILFDKFGIKK